MIKMHDYSQELVQQMNIILISKLIVLSLSLYIVYIYNKELYVCY